MKQILALEIMLSGESVLLTGQAGAGKTFVLNEFIKLARSEGKTVAVTATTGLAASHLGGNTIHAWSGMGVLNELPRGFFKHLSKGRIDTISKTDVLIIDEISMLHDYRLDMLDEITRKVRERPDEPFGGLQVVLCGDFFQLPPINRGDGPEGRFAVHAQAWQALNPTICYLSEQHRQSDEQFLEILTAIRNGDVRRRHAQALLDRIQPQAVESDKEATELHTTNVDVDSINQLALGQLPGDEFSYQMVTTGSDNYVESLKRSCLAQETLTLKEGALVMCIKNAADKKYVNGSLGTVIGFEDDTYHPIVRLKNGKVHTVRPDTWEMRDGTKKRASLAQIPLRLAWAITIHKSQGMTLDAARIDLRKAFVEGMGYVALSRVKQLDSLTLVGINHMALRVSQDALTINKHLQQRSDQDLLKFKHLEGAAKKRSSTDGPKESTGKSSAWSERVREMRLTYPRAFMPWSKDEDAKLQQLFMDGVAIDLMCQELGRQPGGIEARIKKHFGDDVKIATLPGDSTRQ